MTKWVEIDWQQLQLVTPIFYFCALECLIYTFNDMDKTSDPESTATLTLKSLIRR
jgi:hypothetical protein